MCCIAAVINDHKLSGLDNTNLLAYNSACQNSEMSLMWLK